MLTKRVYKKISAQLEKKIPKELAIEYKDLKECINSLFDINIKKDTTPDKKADCIALGYLQTVQWGFLALCTNKNKNNEDSNQFHFLFNSLTTIISNTTLAIIKLTLDGLEYQAYILLRNLYEVCFTLLNILLNPEKRSALHESAINDNEYDIWKKYFTFKKLTNEIDKYERKITSTGNSIIDRDWKNENYKGFSEIVHNSYLSLIIYTYAMPDCNDHMKFNLWGHHVTRVDNIIMSMNDVLLYTAMVLFYALSDKDIDIDMETAFDTKDELWKYATYIHFFTIEYSINIKQQETEHNKH